MYVRGPAPKRARAGLITESGVSWLSSYWYSHSLSFPLLAQGQAETQVVPEWQHACVRGHRMKSLLQCFLDARQTYGKDH